VASWRSTGNRFQLWDQERRGRFEDAAPVLPKRLGTLVHPSFAALCPAPSTGIIRQPAVPSSLRFAERQVIYPTAPLLGGLAAAGSRRSVNRGATANGDPVAHGLLHTHFTGKVRWIAS